MRVRLIHPVLLEIDFTFMALGMARWCISLFPTRETGTKVEVRRSESVWQVLLGGHEIAGCFFVDCIVTLVGSVSESMWVYRSMSS
jgi:hypothetical protein